jgi:hypothetical protein
MDRMHKLANIARKKYGGRQVTPDEARALFEEYIPGLRQQQKGEVIATTIERFLAPMSEEIRGSFESGVRELFEYRNFKRFRTRAFTLLMIAFANGSSEGKYFDLLGLIKSVSREKADKYKVLDSE